MAITTTDLECGGVTAHYVHGAVTADFGVLLLPSIHGREAYVMNYVRSLAQAGFPTLMWDLFRGEDEAHTREERTARGARLTDAGSMQQMLRLLDYMLGDLGMKKVVALGFCLGGRYGLVLAAHDNRLAGLVSYYPTIETPRLKSQEWDVVAEAADITCPVHMMVPGNDHLTSRAVFEDLQKSLQSRNYPTSIQYLPKAEHAFLQTDRRTGHANEQAVALSRASTFAFLDAVLKADNKAASSTERQREQCWLMSVDLVDPAPALEVSMEEIGRRHHEYIQELEATGVLVGAGAFRDEHGARQGTGLIIIRSHTRTEAEAIARREPYIAHGLRLLKLVPWQRSAGRPA
jgi:carboxymethylenebutenolidase